MYSALSQLGLKYSDDTHDSFTCHHTRSISAFTPQPQSFTTLWPVLILPTHGRMARLSWLGWLVTYRGKAPAPRGHPSHDLEPSYMNLTHIPWRICANFLGEGFQVSSYCLTYIYTYIHTYRQTDKQTQPKSHTMPLCRWSEIQTNIQHMQLIRVFYTAVAYKYNLHEMQVSNKQFIVSPSTVWR